MQLLGAHLILGHTRFKLHHVRLHIEQRAKGFTYFLIQGRSPSTVMVWVRCPRRTWRARSIVPLSAGMTAAEEVEQRTFPTPIGTNQTNLASCLDVPGNVVQDRYASEGFGDVFCAEQRHRNQSKHSQPPSRAWRRRLCLPAFLTKLWRASYNAIYRFLFYPCCALAAFGSAM